MIRLSVLWQAYCREIRRTGLAVAVLVFAIIFRGGGISRADELTQRLVPPVGSKTGAVKCVAFSPDGSKIVAGFAGPDAIVWDANTGRVLHILHGDYSPISCAAFALSGDFVVTGQGAWLHTYREAVRVWSTSSGRLVSKLPGCRECGTTSIVFLPDGEHVLVGCTMFEFRTKKVKWSFEIGSGHVNVSRVSRDGSKTLFGGWYRTGHHSPTRGFVAICDASSGRYQCILGYEEDERLGDHVDDASFCLPEGQVVVLTDEHVRRWDWEDRELIQTYTVRPGVFVLCLCVSHDGTRMLVGLSNNDTEIWAINTGRILRTFHDHSSPVTSVCFSPNDCQILTGSEDGQIFLRDVYSASRDEMAGFSRSKHRGHPRSDGAPNNDTPAKGR